MKHGFYEHYFRDWAESSVRTPEGKHVGVKRVYIGDYYRQDLSAWQYAAVRVGYVLLFAGAVYLFIHAAFRDTISNMVLLVALPTGAAVLALFCLLLALAVYVFSKKEMTVGEHWESSVLMRQIAAAAAGCVGCAAVFTLVCAARHPRSLATEEYKAAAEFAVSALLLLTMSLVERRIPYITRPSGNEKPDDSLRI